MRPLSMICNVYLIHVVSINVLFIMFAPFLQNYEYFIGDEMQLYHKQILKTIFQS